MFIISTYILLLKMAISMGTPLNVTFFNNLKSEIPKTVSEKCQLQLLEYFQNFELDESSWALQMFDATSKLPTGLLSYNFGEMGNFDQCINIHTDKTQFGEIMGKYCLGSLGVNQTALAQHTGGSLGTVSNLLKNGNTQGPTWAICVPNGCTATDVSLLVNQLFYSLTNQEFVTVNFPDMFCQTKNDVYQDLTPGAIFTISFLGLLTTLTVLSTIYDLICLHYQKSPYHIMLTAFSIYSNGKKIFKTTSATTDQLPCLDGLKFISMMWVVAGHSYSVPGSGPLINTKDILKWIDSLHSMFIVSGTLSVDTFIVITGSLMTFGFLKAKQKGIKFNVGLYYIHRYLRLTPPLALVVLISATLLKYLGSGPKWPLLEQYFQQFCVDNWWSALLYVQNYVNVDRMCVGQTWYLSIDMQLYIISPIIFWTLWKYPKIGLSVLSAGVLIPMVLSFYIAWTNNLTAILSNFNGNASEYNNKYYLLTHTRASTWFIGAILGYVLYKIRYQHLNFKINKKSALLIWLLCFIVMFACIFGGFNTLRDKNYDHWGNSLHIAFVRPVWAICISWIIISCTLGYGGPINWFLSLQIYQIFNRFTYSIYLTHVTMLYMIIYNMKSPDYFSDFKMAYGFWGTLWFSVGLSVFLVFTVESPIIIFEKILLKPPQKKVQNNNNVESGIDNLAFKQ